MAEIRFQLDIPPERYLAWYQGQARDVVVRAHDGRTVQFPANVLRRFVAHDGIRGEFVLRFDEQQRFVGIERIGG